MKKFAGALILLIVGTLISCPKPTGSPSKAWVVSTLAGGGNPAEFNGPYGVAVDASGNVYVTDKFNHRIRKITSEGDVSTLAGGSTPAQFNGPIGVAVDSSDNVYVADQSNHRIRKITSGGEVSTLAGGGNPAEFNWPTDVAVDSSGNVYVADMANYRIRKIAPVAEGGVSVSTLAGTGTQGYQDGDDTEAKFDQPTGVAVDAKGIVYVADFSNNRIRKITSGGEVDTLAGTGTAGSKDGAGTSAQFNEPTGVALDAEGNVYVADFSNNRIRKITSGGEVDTLAGTGTAGSADGDDTAAQFYTPTGVAVDSSGNVYVADSDNHLIRKITPEGVVSTLAGSGTEGSKDGAGTSAQFNYPTDVAVDSSGNVYVADYSNHLIRKIEYKVP